MALSEKKNWDFIYSQVFSILMIWLLSDLVKFIKCFAKKNHALKGSNQLEKFNNKEENNENLNFYIVYGKKEQFTPRENSFTLPMLK
jgi:hypothetical protein